ncbi:GNAT family N-acetyltransferase [Rhodopseudomonas palustris]|uniref:GNAT family N-acetyltransferase n=1 Tax=Rhodopseudomonas palustris TaxID=1076 RepID=UPI000164A739|nr:GNAT family N-acetyltransferase [Rhodopseudomonas palustris]ACF01294.1 GCN5-related N-acetyltransferase [Rhodopseudomonas palustris TIE-1]QLH71512.1 GNAT family N-acetyltransferase [Rhodopseudomonas palustris]RIA02147.1 GNAT family N-acetyltransferase [Rhodopseudomonas palustris]WBU27729.1 GNAT family N-acetyltransferase [Rhodopseudomonas palustris]
MAVEIRPVGPDERAAWEPLWAGYLAFYKATLAPEVSDVTWGRFHDPAEPMHLLGAYVDGKLTGIVQFIYHRSCWTVGDYCYLQDLFVADTARGLGLGRKLIEAVYARAKADGCSRVHWLTQTGNATARLLYDRIAEDSGFMQYRKIL